jgi:hypothetical protein
MPGLYESSVSKKRLVINSELKIIRGYPVQRRSIIQQGVNTCAF